MKNLLLLSVLFCSLCHATTHEVFIGKVFGRTDDTQAFTDAINFGRGDTTNVHVGPGVFNFSHKVGFLYSNVNVLADSATTTFVPTWSSAGESFIGAYGQLLSSSSVSIPVSTGNTFSYAGALNVGDLVQLLGPVYVTLPDGKTYSNGWFGVAPSHSGSTVTMNNTAQETYTATTLKRYKPLTNIHINGMRLNLSSWTKGRGIELKMVTNSSIDHCVLNGPSNSAVGPTQGFIVEGDNVQIVNNNIHDFLYLYTGTSCYAINPQGNNVVCQGNKFYRARVCIESGGREYISRGIDYIGNYFEDITSITLGFHGNTYGSIHDNIIKQKVQVIGGSTTGDKSISLRHFHGKVYHNYLYIDNTTNHTERAIWMQENGYSDIEIYDNWIVYIGGSASNNRFIAASNLQGTITNYNIHDNHVWNGSVSLSSPYGTGIQIYANEFFALGITGSINPTSCTGCTINTNTRFTGIAAPTETVLGTTPTPPSGGDTTVIVTPPPPPDDSIQVTPVEWKDTTAVSMSFTVPTTPKLQKIRWINKDKGGIINLPSPTNTASKGLVVEFFNDTKQPIEVNRTLYTRFASGRKHHRVAAEVRSTFYDGGNRLTIISGKFKLDKI
jgi:hypothetical protein